MSSIVVNLGEESKPMVAITALPTRYSLFPSSLLTGVSCLEWGMCVTCSQLKHSCILPVWAGDTHPDCQAVMPKGSHQSSWEENYSFVFFLAQNVTWCWKPRAGMESRKDPGSLSNWTTPLDFVSFEESTPYCVHTNLRDIWNSQQWQLASAYTSSAMRQEWLH